MGEGLKRVLVACEESQTVTKEFRRLGHEAYSCDILPCSGGYPEWHLQCDVREVLNEHWDIIIAHPECTYITNSGVCHLDKDPSRWKKLWDACEFFKLFINHPCEKIAVENPIPHKYALGWIGKNYNQLIQPYHFGHLERKATCLWLKGLPKLAHTNDVRELMKALPKSKQQRIHYMSPGPERSKLRSKTFQGIAKAMAEQWGDVIKNHLPFKEQVV